MLPSSRRQFLKTGAAASTVGLTGLAGCLGSDGNTLRFNFVVPVENIGSLLDISELREEMDNIDDAYELEVNQDASTPDSVNALAADEADIALLTMESFPNAVAADAVPGGITTVACDFWDAHPDRFAVTVRSLPDSDITEPEDLEGSAVAVNAVGTGVHAVYVKMFSELGIDYEEDVEFIEQGFPTFIPGLEDGIFDAAIFPAAYDVGARAEGLTEVFTTRDAFQEELQPYPYIFTTVSNNALDEKEEEIDGWVEDFQNLVEYMEENRSEVISLAADHFEMDEGHLDEFFLTEEYDYHREFEIDFDAMQGIVDEMYELGLTDSEVDMEEHATNEYIG